MAGNMFRDKKRPLMWAIRGLEITKSINDLAEYSTKILPDY